MSCFLRSEKFRSLVFDKASHIKALKCWEEFSDLKILFYVFAFYSLSFPLFFLEFGVQHSRAWS